MTSRSKVSADAVDSASKAVMAVLRRQETTRSQADEAEHSVELSVCAGFLKSWLKGLTSGRDSAEGTIVSIVFAPRMENRITTLCRNITRIAGSRADLSCNVTDTSIGPAARFIWSSAPESPEDLVRHGYPIMVAEVLATIFQLRTVDMLKTVGVPARTAARRISDDKTLKPDESDRLFRAGDVMFHTLEVFGDLERAREFLMTPNPALSGSTPLSLLDTVPGRDRVINLLGQIEHGVYA